MLHSVHEEIATLLSVVVFVGGFWWLLVVAVFHDACSPRTLLCVSVVGSVTLSMRLSVPLLDYASPLVYALCIVIGWNALKRVSVPRRVARFFKL